MQMNRSLPLLLCTFLAGCIGSPSDQANTAPTKGEPAAAVARSLTAGPLTAEPRTDAIRLAWPEVVDAYGYHLYHAAEPGVDSATAERFDIYDGTGMVHTGLAPGSAHYYRVSALTEAGEGPLSTELRVVLASWTMSGRDDAAAY